MVEISNTGFRVVTLLVGSAVLFAHGAHVCSRFDDFDCSPHVESERALAAMGAVASTSTGVTSGVVR